MVRIVQCLCPQRHCIFGFAYDDRYKVEGEATDELRAIIRDMIAHRMIDAACGICGSNDFQYEDAATPFATMEEAREPLAKAQAANLATRAAIEWSKAAPNN